MPNNGLPAKVNPQNSVSQNPGTKARELLLSRTRRRSLWFTALQYSLHPGSGTEHILR